MGIPKGWTDIQPAMACGLVDDTFFVFKTPLHAHLNAGLPTESKLSPEKVRLELQSKHEKEIGLWMDMNNTEKYFDPKEIRAMGVTYEPFRFPGFRTPTRAQQENFNQICDDFLASNKEGVIAINSSNGFNRPGFFICSYLVTRRGFGVIDALDEFRRVRSPGIYEQIMVNALVGIYNQHYKPADAPAVEVPTVHVPEWDVNRGRQQRRQREQQELDNREDVELAAQLQNVNL